MTRIPTWLSVGAILAVLVVGVVYLSGEVLKYSPTRDTTTVNVKMASSGGLRAGSSVVYRGVDIGSVEEVVSIPGAVRLRVAYDASYKIPADSDIKIESLSTLGEPVFAFMPNSTEAPYIGDKAVVETAVDIPASVPELLGSTSGLLDQTDPETLSSLVSTFYDSMQGLEESMPEIRRGADLLLKTLVRHQPSLEASIANLMKVMADSDWVKPALTSAPPQMDAFGFTLGDSYKYLFEGSAVLRGREVLGSWREEEAQLVDYLQRVAPDLEAIAQSLRPVTQATGPLLGTIDMGTLLEQAIAGFPGDRMRISVTSPR